MRSKNAILYYALSKSKNKGEIGMLIKAIKMMSWRDLVNTTQ
jgi:hypothetical protein